MVLRRTQLEIKDDFELIKSTAKYVASFKELANRVGLSYQQIHYTLSLTPGALEEVKALLKTNARGETATPRFFQSEVTTQNSEVNTTNDEKTCQEQPTSVRTEIHEEVTILPKKVVIDASVCKISTATRDILQQMRKGNKIVITHLTLMEFEKLQASSNQPDSTVAMKILNMAAKYPESFEIVEIEQAHNDINSCIIQYCKEQRDDVILLTANRVMALKARMVPNSVQTIYLEFKELISTNNTTSTTSTTPHAFAMARFLELTKMVDGKITLTRFNNDKTNIRVITSQERPTKYPYELRVNDLLYAATLNKDDSINFHVYRVNSVINAAKWPILFSYRYTTPENSRITNAEYNVFLSDFRKQHPFSQK